MMPRPPLAFMLGAAALTLLTLPSTVRAQDPARWRPARRKVESFFSPKGGIATAAARDIGLAKKHIDIAMYSISTGTGRPIFDALKAAAARGVKIRMVLNKARTGSSNKRKSLALENIGVDVLYTTRTMHQKFAIIDGKLLDNGSANWSSSADEKYSENMQSIRSPKYLIRAFKKQFRHLLSVARDFDPEDFR